MAINLNKKKGLVGEINVTPLVDVMLVLLVIFMISTPLLYNGVKLQLPKTKKVNSLQLKEENFILSIKEDGKMYVGEKETALAQLQSIIKDSPLTSGQPLYLRADYQLNYGEVAKAMALLKSWGVVNISLVTQVGQ